MLLTPSHPSVLAQSRLGPRTMAMLLGVILFTSLSWASLAKNFTRYLQKNTAVIISIDTNSHSHNRKKWEASVT